MECKCGNKDLIFIEQKLSHKNQKAIKKIDITALIGAIITFISALVGLILLNQYIFVIPLFAFFVLKEILEISKENMKKEKELIFFCRNCHKLITIKTAE